MARPAVVIALPRDEHGPVSEELAAAGFEIFRVDDPDDLEVLLDTRKDIAVAILDGEADSGQVVEYHSHLHRAGRSIPALMVVSDRTLDKLSNGAGPESIDDEYLTRPYSTESVRWRLEAMLIRSQTVDDGSGPVIQSQPLEGAGDWARRATLLAIFNPKGGVGKTTVATNLAAALQINHGQRVLLIDADTVTGHVATSLGIEHQRTLVDSFRDEAEGGPPETLLEIAAAHPTGLRVVSLVSSPLHAELLEPERVAESIGNARRGFDFVVVDMHPSYGQLNLEIFDRADRILVPVTPDLPALRAAVQLREVATELGILDRIAMIVNRANSGVSVSDMERTVGMPALALIRSGGLLFVRAANEGRTVIERFPKEKVTEDFQALAECVVPKARTERPQPVLRGLFGRSKEPARAQAS